MEWIRAIFVGTLALTLSLQAVSAQAPGAQALPSSGGTLPTPVFGPQIDVSADGKCGPGCGFYTGASLYLLRPYFAGGNTAYVTNTGIGTASLGQTTTDFSWNYSASPAVWLGWSADCGLGIRGRFFYFDQSSQTASTSLSLDQSFSGSITPPSSVPAPPGPVGFFAPGSILTIGSGVGIAGLNNDQLTFASSLRVSVADLEATWMGQLGNWSWVLGGGGRYLQMAQNYNGTLTNGLNAAQGGPVSETQTLSMSRTFNGFGPTISFRGDYHVFNTGLSLYGDVRGSFLVGSSQQATNYNSVIVDPNGIIGGSRQQGYAVNTSRDTTMPVLEIELGVAYTFMLLGRFQTIVSAGAVNQTYFDAGSASQTNGSLSLFGGRFSLGFQF